MQKLTKKIVESILPQEKDLILWDSEISGFFCKITPTGKKSYFLYYRTQDRRQRRPKIGDHGIMTCEQARNIAQRWLLEVSQGKDPSGEKQEVRQTPILKELAEKYMKEHAPNKKLSSCKEDQRLRSEVSQGKDPSGEKQEVRQTPILKELAEKYMKEHAPNKKLSSCKEDQRLWNQFILPALGALKVSSIERSDISKLHHSLQHLPTTANRVRSLLSKALNLAELWGYRPNHSNPCLHIKKYSETKRERFLSQGEIARLMGALAEEERDNTNPWPLYAIRLLLITGFLQNEILPRKREAFPPQSPSLLLPLSMAG